MKILVLGDLHGEKPKLRIKDFDAIVCFGDVCSDKESNFTATVVKTFCKVTKFSIINVSALLFLGEDDFLFLCVFLSSLFLLVIY